VTPADDARAFELVRTQGLSYKTAGKMLGGDGSPVPKTTIRAAVTREAVRRAGTAKTGVPAVEPTADTGFMARVLAAGPLPDADDELDVSGLLGADKPMRGTTPLDGPVPDRLHLDGDADDEDAADLDYGKWCRARIRKIERTIAMLEAEGNVGEAQKFYRTLEKLSAGLRQHEKAERADEGVMTYTLADVEAVRADLRQKVRDTQHRGLVCAECGRKMRRAEAEGDNNESS
jgi:hypothetical protein